MKPNKVIGLTGSIASGKSTAASILKKEYGIFCIDADQVGHEILEDPKVKARLLEAFGPDIFRDDHSVNRKALGDLVFEQEERLETLNQITHPAIIASIEERLQKADTTAPFLMIEAYGLLQTDLKDMVDEVWVVGCDRKTRLRRVMERQHLTEEEAKARINGQWPDEKYRDAADVYLDGSGTEEFLKEQCDLLMKRYV